MTHLNLLEGTINHGNEHVEQHYHHGNIVNSVQDVTSVLDEFVSVVDHYGSDLRQSKYSPEQCLEALLQAGRMHRRIKGQRENRGKLFLNSNQPYTINVRDTLLVNQQKDKMFFGVKITE